MKITDREFAIALVLELAESGLPSFAPAGFYDDDSEFLDDLASRLSLVRDKKFDSRLRRVLRKLVNFNVMYRIMRCTYKEYFGEPTKQMEYGFSNPGKAHLLTVGKTEHTMDPRWEAEFLLRHAYPKD